MVFKTRYNAGDIVLFYNKKISDNDIGQIKKVSFCFSHISGKEETYRIEPIKIECDYYDKSVCVDKRDIRGKLSKRAFKKAFVKKCVNHISNKHDNKGNDSNA